MRGRYVAVQRAAILTLCATATVGCTATREHSIVPVPARAIAVAALQDDGVAVLAGTDDAKTVSIIDFSDAIVANVFGVPKEAVGIVSDDGGDALIIPVGGTHHNRPFGAIERWRIDGNKIEVVALPARPTAITQVISVSATCYCR